MANRPRLGRSSPSRNAGAQAWMRWHGDDDGRNERHGIQSPPLEQESIVRPLEQESYPPAGYAWYVVAVLTLAYILSFIDRQILNLMVDPIRHDLGIGEKQMSLLMGASFAVFYTFFGIPLGRLADTRSRRALIAGGIALWS